MSNSATAWSVRPFDLMARILISTILSPERDPLGLFSVSIQNRGRTWWLAWEGSKRAFSVWEFVPAVGWVLRASDGQIQNLHYGQAYRLEVAQTGQRLSLTVDDVPILDHLLSSPLPGNQLGLYSMSKCAVVFQDFRVLKKHPTAFVAMQFDEPSNTIYREVIQPVAESVDLDVVNIGEIDRPGIIFQEIQKNIEDASLVIAEITAPNQNVFYEVGYAHALKKPTILLVQRQKDLPFDIRSYRVIFYDDSIGGKPLIEKTLRNHLRSILQDI